MEQTFSAVQQILLGNDFSERFIRLRPYHNNYAAVKERGSSLTVHISTFFVLVWTEYRCFVGNNKKERYKNATNDTNTV